MIKNLLFSSLLLLVVLFQSCVTAKLTSNKSADYNKQPKRMFILMNAAKKANYFSDEFLDSLMMKLKVKGVVCDSYQHNPLSLETNEDINKKIYNFSPEAIMMIKQTEVHSTSVTVDGGKFEISIIDVESKKPFWKGEFEIYAQGGLSEAVDKAVEELIKRLTTDKIII